MRRHPTSRPSSKTALFFAQIRLLDFYQTICARVRIRTAIKQSLMWFYNHHFVKGSTVLRLFDKYQLWNA